MIPTMYLHHLLDPEMIPIYYSFGGLYYRLQTRFVNGSCVALKSGRGCALGDSRPLICKVWPFWWKSGSNPSASNFPIEINGDCTMATRWNMSTEEILREFGSSDSAVRRDLLTLKKALEEHGKMLREAKRKIPPKKLLDWVFSNVI